MNCSGGSSAYFWYSGCVNGIGEQTIYNKGFVMLRAVFCGPTRRIRQHSNFWRIRGAKRDRKIIGIYVADELKTQVAFA